MFQASAKSRKKPVHTNGLLRLFAVMGCSYSRPNAVTFSCSLESAVEHASIMSCREIQEVFKSRHCKIRVQAYVTKFVLNAGDVVVVGVFIILTQTILKANKLTIRHKINIQLSSQEAP